MQFAGTIKFASAVLEGENEKYHESGPQTNHTTSYDRNNLLPSKEQRFPVFGCLFTVRATVGGWVSLFRDFVHEIKKKKRRKESPTVKGRPKWKRFNFFSFKVSTDSFWECWRNRKNNFANPIQITKKKKHKNYRKRKKKRRGTLGNGVELNSFTFYPQHTNRKVFSFFFFLFSFYRGNFHFGRW